MVSESSYEAETVMIDRQDEDETAETMEKWLSQASGHNPKSSTLAVPCIDAIGGS